MTSTPETEKIIRVGSRKSELALVQTKHVISSLQKLFPKKKFEIHTMTTMGDRVLNISLPKIGEKSLFTKDLEDALHNGSIDFVVHSLKDLPTCLPDGMSIGAILEREDPRDALVLSKKFEGQSLKTLPSGSVIGTSSLRRTAQLCRNYPQLIVQDIRGNLNTRLAKLDIENSKYSGIILAQAGILRMGWQNRISQSLEPCDVLYAVGQGALAVECRSNDTEILEMLGKLSCLQTQCRILAERSFLKTLGGGCSAPVAVHTILSKGEVIEENSPQSPPYELNINGAVWSLDGKIEVLGAEKCTLNLNCSRKRASDGNGTSLIAQKKARLSIDEGDHVNRIDLSPPKIIAHPQTTFNKSDGAPNAENVELAELIHIHEDAFKKCPYSSVLSSALSPSAGNTVENELKRLPNPPVKCPLHFPIGQDVMGQCPYFDTSDEQNLNALNRVEPSEQKDGEQKASCPFADKAEKTNKICPFSNKIVSDNLTEPIVDKLDSKVAKCPYLGASSSSGIQPTSNEIQDVPCEKQNLANNVRLFCGLYPHSCYPIDIFETCEAIGQKLAAQLIENGALKVMEAAQSEIRQST